MKRLCAAVRDYNRDPQVIKNVENKLLWGAQPQLVICSVTPVCKAQGKSQKRGIEVLRAIRPRTPAERLCSLDMTWKTHP